MYWKKITALVLFFLIINSPATIAQSKLIVEKINKPGKIRILDLKRNYTIKVLDTIYINTDIVDYSDTSISILHSYYKDTTISYPGNFNSKDSVLLKSIRLEDTLKIAFSDIQYIKTDWFKHNDLFEPFAWSPVILMMTALAMPVVAISDGKEGIRDLLMFDAIIVIVNIQPLIISNIETQYNLKTKWILKTIK